MIRFKVIKASRLLMWLLVVVLALVLGAMLLFMIPERGGAPVSNELMGTSIVNRSNGQDEVVAAFAVAASFNTETDGGALFTPRDEDEHTDSVVSSIVIERILDEEPAPFKLPPSGGQKRVLIYHTHTHEAYEKQPVDSYTETEAWRTADPAHSIVRVGDELRAALASLGIDAVHDKTDHEPPRLGTAYTRSLATLEGYAEQSFDLYIDLHRDAYIEHHQPNQLQMMVLLGNGEGFDEKPFFPENMAFAQQLTRALNQIQPNICKDVLVKNGRYNQHVARPMILIEVGNNKNTLAEALAAMPTLAEGISAALRGDIYATAQRP